MKSWQRALGMMAVAALVLAGAALATRAEPAKASGNAKGAERNPKWAVPMKAPGVPNLHRISDTLYRSAQPTPEGFKSIEALGIRTVINLRNKHDDNDEAKGTGLRLERVQAEADEIADNEVIEALALLAKKENGPFLIHCQHGADRTGLVCAMYRILYQGWTKEEALAEMKSGGYGFHAVWMNIPKYIASADVEALRKKIEARSQEKGKGNGAGSAGAAPSGPANN